MNIKTRLAVMNFLEFAVWGAYLTSMGNYLGKAGMGAEIAWFYAIQGIVSIFMPTIVGIVADKYVQPQRMLGICHLLAGLGMVGLFYLGMTNAQPDKTTFIAIYSLSVAFYMPTLALSNTAAFAILKGKGYDTVTDFPPIRVLGTVGFIVTMWFVNCASWDNGAFSFGFAANDFKFQYTHMQFLVSGILSFVLFAYCMTLPACPIVKHEEKKSVAEMLGFSAFKLFKDKKMALFFIFSCLLGMSLQVTNSYATPFITSFKGVVGVNLTSVGGSLHSYDPVLPAPLWHQDSDAYRYVCMGGTLRLLRFGQSRHAGCHSLCPVLRCLWCGLRLL